jgi:hypothetical protein
VSESQEQQRAALARMYDGRSYKIYRNARRWWDFPYTVVKPDGGVLTVASTLRRARRAVRHHQRQTQQPKQHWWENLVEELEP